MDYCYIVTDGEYDSYEIKAVFSKLEDAERYCATHNLSRYDSYIVEKWPLDETTYGDVPGFGYMYELWGDETLVETPMFKTVFDKRIKDELDILRIHYPKLTDLKCTVVWLEKSEPEKARSILKDIRAYNRAIRADKDRTCDYNRLINKPSINGKD